MPEKDIKILLKKKKKKRISIIMNLINIIQKQRLVEYRINYYITYNK